MPTDQKVDRQQGSSKQINTTGHSTPLTITSVQLNGTGRPVLLHRISVWDEEATSKGGGHPLRAHASRLVRLSAGSLSAKIARKVPVRSASAVASATVVAYQRRQRADLLVSIIANAVNRNKRPVGLVRIE